MNCPHVLTDNRKGTGHHLCLCCRRSLAKVGNCPDCEGRLEPREKRISFATSVEPATVGTCFLCSDPNAAFKFRNDNSVRICERCVK